MAIAFGLADCCGNGEGKKIGGKKKRLPEPHLFFAIIFLPQHRSDMGNCFQQHDTASYCKAR